VCSSDLFESQARTPKASARYYADVIAAHRRAHS